MHNDNIVLTVPGVPSLAECRQLCQDTDVCHYFTFFGPASEPFSNTCIGFSICDILHDCADCVTEHDGCLPLSDLCSEAIESHIAENLVKIVSDVVKEQDCKSACSAEEACAFYTHHDAADPIFADNCFMLAWLMEPMRPCQHCRTGGQDCFDSKGCLFVQDEGEVKNVTTSMMITDTSTPITGWTLS